MLVFILNQHGKPLMPCTPQKARKLLESGKARVVRRTPFTIKLLHGSSGYTQAVTGGMDTGSKMVGVAVSANGKVLYQAEIKLRTDVSKKMERRSMYRRNRRGRKCRYRPARWLNRASVRREGRLAPSVQSKLDSHLREKHFVESILPVAKWRVETAVFDIHKISNPDVIDYQAGDQKGYYNVKAYVLSRDKYKCQSKQKIKHSDKLHVHHIVFRSDGGTNAPSNLITLCECCHNALHAGEFEIKGSASKTKHATEAGIIQARLKKSDWLFEETFGYRTKWQREQVLTLPKSHANDAVAICVEDGELVKPANIIYRKVHVARGDYQQTKGVRSQMRLPTGKLHGLRKFDLINTSKGTGFVKGKRATGHFAIMDIHGQTITTSVNVKQRCQRITARTSTLTIGEPSLGLAA